MRRSKALKRSHGLVFDVVPTDQLMPEARRLITMAEQSDEWKKDRERRQQPLGMTADQVAFTFSIAEEYVSQQDRQSLSCRL